MRKLIYIILLVPMITLAQQKVEGIVLEVVNNKEVPLPGANVFWLNADVGDVTDFRRSACAGER